MTKLYDDPAKEESGTSTYSTDAATSPKRADDDLASHPSLPKTNAYLRRIGAEWRNFRKAVVVEREGKYRHVTAEVRFGADGAVKCPDDIKPTNEEAEEIKAEFPA